MLTEIEESGNISDIMDERCRLIREFLFLILDLAELSKLNSSGIIEFFSAL